MRKGKQKLDEVRTLAIQLKSVMLLEYSRGMMIESIMHVYGICQPNPLAFRRWLESLSYEDLAKEFEKLEN